MPTRNLTILFTDIQGFTARTSSETRAGVADLLASHERLLAPTFAHFGGTVIKTIGDAFLVTFESPTDAVVCGLAIQEVLRQHNAPLPPDRHLKVRVAINVGEVELKDGDIFGEPVNLAARLEGITEAGEVYFTEAVYLTMNRREAPATEVGERTFKGIPGTVRVYKVVQDTSSEHLQALARSVSVDESGGVTFLSRAASPPAAPLPDAEQKQGKRRSLLAPAIAGIFVLGALGVGLWAVPVISERMVVTRAQTLVDQGNPEAALKLLNQRLDAHPTDVHLRDYTLKVANREVDALVAKKGAAPALAFIQAQVKAHPVLARLANREPALDADVTLQHALRHLPEYRLWQTVRQLVNERYPKDPDVPYVAAQRLSRRMISSSILWLYRDALERGHAKTNAMFQACTRTLARNPPGSSEAGSAMAMIDHTFSKRKLAWAKDALAHGTGLALANAWPVLEKTHEPKLSDSWLKSLHAVMVEDPTKPASQLAAQMDPTRGGRAQKVLAQALRRDGLSADQKAAIQHAALTLEARFGAAPEK